MGFWTTVALVTSALAGTGASIANTQQQAKSSKSAANAAAAQSAQAISDLKSSQAAASSQAQAVISQKQRRVKAASQSIYTNPLGIGGTANVARKYLLGQ